MAGMAAERMIHRTVICSDEFIEMTFEAQALYFQLTIEADNFGFVGGVKKIMRSIGAGESALAELEKARFVIRFDTGVIVLRHWMVANGNFKNDRNYPANYPRELAKVALLEDLTYELDSVWNPDGIQMEPQYNSSSSQYKIMQIINKALQRQRNAESSSASDNTRARMREESTDNPSAINGGNSPPPHDSIVYEDDNGRRYTLREYMVKHSSEYWKITNSTWQTAESFRKYMNDDLIRFAFDQTVGRGAESPDKYFRSVLLDYVQSGFHTEQDAIDRENQRAEPLKAKTYAEPEDFY